MLSIVADLKQFYERLSAYTHPNLHQFNLLWGIMIEYKLIPRFRSLWCHQRRGKFTTAFGLRLQAVVSLGSLVTHNDPNLGINSYNSSLWRHNGRDSVSNHQPHDCLLNRLFRRRPKKTSKLRVNGLCVLGELPAQMASYADNVSIWWRHHIPGICIWYERWIPLTYGQ